ncbi:hypothetical protein SCANM124S_08515 [Streptomyces canus]
MKILSTCSPASATVTVAVSRSTPSSTWRAQASPRLPVATACPDRTVTGWSSSPTATRRCPRSSSEGSRNTVTGKVPVLPNRTRYRNSGAREAKSPVTGAAVEGTASTAPVRRPRPRTVRQPQPLRPTLRSACAASIDT